MEGASFAAIQPASITSRAEVPPICQCGHGALKPAHCRAKRTGVFLHPPGPSAPTHKLPVMEPGEFQPLFRQHEGLQQCGPCLKLLYLHGYLSPTDRLSLFQASKGMAAAVRQGTGWDLEGTQAQGVQLPGEQVQRKGKIISDQAGVGRGAYQRAQHRGHPDTCLQAVKLVYADGQAHCIPLRADSVSSRVFSQGLQLPGPCLSTLLCNHLTAADRLALFQCSRGMAAAVLQHARWGTTGRQVGAVCEQAKSRQTAARSSTYSVKLTLRAEHEDGAHPQQLQAQQHALQLLLSAEPSVDLHVQLSGHRVSCRWACLPWHQITKLSLADMNLPADLPTMLSLQQCSNLHTLSISNVGCSQQSHQLLSSLSEQQQAAFLAPSLKHIEVNGQQAWVGLSAWAQLLGKQVTHVTLKLYNRLEPGQSSHALCMHLLQSSQPLPSTLEVLSHFATNGLITDDLMGSLTALPTLTHVTAAGIFLRKHHSGMQFRWQELCLDCEGSALGPPGMHMPHVQLQHIKKIVLRGGLNVLDWYGGALASQLQAHPSVVCKPTSQLGSPLSRLPSNTFSMFDGYTAELVQVCARVLEGHQVCLLLNSGPRADVLPAIRVLPPKVTSLTFQWNRPDTKWPVTDPQEEHSTMQQLAEAIPLQVTAITFNTPQDVSQAWGWAAAMLTELAAIKHHIKVFLGTVTWDHEALVQLVQAHSGQVYTHCKAPGHEAAREVVLMFVDGRVECVPVCA